MIVALTPLRRMLIAAALLGLFVVFAYWYIDRQIRRSYEEMRKYRVSTAIENSPTPRP